MLDRNGQVAELNDTNLFALMGVALHTPDHDQLPGRHHPRAGALELAGDLGWPVHERDLSVTELMGADAVFATGTMGELTPVRTIDWALRGQRLGQRTASRAQEGLPPGSTRAVRGGVNGGALRFMEWMDTDGLRPPLPMDALAMAWSPLRPPASA